MNDDNKTVYYAKVIWFDPKKGIGFLAWEKDGVQQKDMFVHFSNLNMENFKTLYKEQNVSFQIGANKNGDPKAINVTILQH